VTRAKVGKEPTQKSDDGSPKTGSGSPKTGSGSPKTGSGSPKTDGATPKTGSGEEKSDKIAKSKRKSSSGSPKKTGSAKKGEEKGSTPEVAESAAPAAGGDGTVPADIPVESGGKEGESDEKQTACLQN
jgi:cytochrome c biogenesis protein